MKIKRLILTAFGKFSNRTIEVSDGFNLFYGENESGKTTIENFIEGVLFGFFKEEEDEPAFSKKHAYYKPWNNDAYCGTMIVEIGDREYRLERDFTKLTDDLTVYDHSTGEDVTVSFLHDDAIRQSMLTDDTLDDVFLFNTINENKRSIISGSDLAKEINRRLFEINVGKKGSLSLARVLSYLDNTKQNILKEIPDGVDANSRIKELQDELVRSEDIYSHIQKNQKKIQQLTKKEQQLLDNTKKKQSADQIENKLEKREALAEAIKISQAEVDRLEEQIAELKEFEYIDGPVLSRLTFLQNNILGISERISTLKEEMPQKEIQLAEIIQKYDELTKHLGDFDRDDFERDFDIYSELKSGNSQINNEDVRDDFDKNLGSHHLEEDTFVDDTMLLDEDIYDDDYKGDLDDLFEDSEHGEFTDEALAGSVRNRIPGKAAIPVAILGIIVIAISLLNPGDLFSGASWIVIDVVGWLLLMSGVILFMVGRRGGEAIVNEGEALKESPQRDNNEVQAAGNPVSNTVLLKYQMDSEEEYEDFAKRVRNIYTYLDHLAVEKDVAERELTANQNELTELESSYRMANDEIENELKNAEITDLKAYTAGLKKQENLETIAETLEKAKARLAEQKAEIEDYHLTEDEINPVVTEVDGEKIRLNETIEAFDDEIARLKEENVAFSQSVGSVVEIKEKIESLTRRTEEVQEDIDACDKAMRVIEEMMQNAESTSIEELKDNIGEMLHTITHKYREVEINDALEIEVVDPEDGDIITIDQLSDGTMDQIYLALRFGITGLLNVESSLPVILDNPFAFYDWKRKRESVSLLWEKCKNQQVLLFTCTSDEKQILDAAGYGYNGVVI